MPDIRRTIYPLLSKRPSTKELHQHYTLSVQEIEIVQNHTRGDSQKVVFATLLKCFQRLNYFPEVKNVPAPIIAYIQSGLNIKTTTGNASEATIYNYHKIIRQILNAQTYQYIGRDLATKTIQQCAQHMTHPADVLNATIETLIQAGIELPAFSTLDRLEKRGRTQVHNQLFQQVAASLDKNSIQMLQGLLVVAKGETITAFTRLKAPPPRASVTHLRKATERLHWLETLIDPIPLLTDLPHAQIKNFADMAHALDVSDMYKLHRDKRRTVLLCLIYRAQTACRDTLVDMFRKLNNKAHKKAQGRLEEIQQQQRKINERLAALLAQVTKKTKKHLNNHQRIGKEVETLLTNQPGGLDAILKECEAVESHQGSNYLPLLPTFYRSYRAALFHLLDELEIQSCTQDQTLINALDFLRQCRTVYRDTLDEIAELDFASPRWQRLVLVHVEGQAGMNRRMFEACVFSYLAAGLHAGDLCVVGSEEYADYREQLLDWEDCEPMLEEHCQAVGIPSEPDKFTQKMKKWLSDTAKEVDQFLSSNDLLRFDANGRPSLRKLAKHLDPPGFKELERDIQQQMPMRNLLEILNNVEKWTNFSRHFGPPSGADPKLANPAERYATTIFTYGTFMGPHQMAQHTDNLNEGVLLKTNRQHITAEKLDAALANIVDTYAHFDLPYFWGTGAIAGADGTQFDSYRNNLKAESHIRYGGFGVMAYHHISDTYIALFSHFISCGVWEAVYILDGLLKNRSDEMQPQIVHADTQGQSLPVFGFAKLLGIDLIPRIRNWKNLTFYRASSDEHYQYIDSLFTAIIDWKLIETHWQDIMQVIISVRAGKIWPSTLLRKLGSYSHKNKLYRAFRELGNVVRTVTLLRIISDEAIRRQTTAMQNKVEGYNGFSKWLSFAGFGKIKTNDPVEMEKRIKYNTLLTSAAILHNVVDMSHLLRQMIANGREITPQQLECLSPYLQDHIRRFGRYTIGENAPPPPIERELPIKPNRKA